MFIRPTVVGDTLYVGSCSGAFYALDRHHGTELWSYDTTVWESDTANFHGNVLIAGDLVVVGSDTVNEGQLYGFDAETGEVRWWQSAPGGFPSDIVGIGSRALAVSMSGEVRCVETDSGRVVWSYEGTEGEKHLRSSIVVRGRRVLVSLPSGSVQALDLKSGKLVWKTDFNARLNTTLAVLDDAVYIGDAEGRIHRLALKDGMLQKSFEAESPVYGALIPVGECIVALWGNDTLACLDPALDGVKWARKTDSTWSSFQPLLREGLVIAGTESGEVHALDPKSGTPVWSRKLEGEIKGLGSAGDVLYVGTLQGRVYAIEIP